MIVIPNMDKPKSCLECWSGLAIAINCEAGTGFHNPDGDLIPPDCPLKESRMIEMERAVNQILWYECIGDVDEYFENDTYIVKPYDWMHDGNNDWHFYHKPSGLKIQWYKYPLRGAMWNMKLTHEQFLDVLYDCKSSRYKNITWDHDKWWERRADEPDDQRN